MRPPPGTPPPPRVECIVLVDGRSGSGKSELAALLAEREDATLLRLDDLYPGWDGLEAGSRWSSLLLEMISDGRPAAYRRWDWERGEPGELVAVEPRRVLVVEGCGALSRVNRSWADLAVWMELDDETRKRRALARDGAVYAPHWERWAAQEERFYAATPPVDLADLVLDGSDVASVLDRVPRG